MNIIKIPTTNSEIMDKVVSDLKSYQVNSSGEFINLNIITLQYNNQQEFNDKIQETFNKTQKPIFLMNDHSLTLQIIKNLKKANDRDKENIGIVIFDAHPDCDLYYKYNFFGDQKDIVLSLVEDNIIEPNNILIVGLRKWTKGEYLFLKNSKIRYFDIKKIDEMGIFEISDILMENLRTFKRFYVSVDMDVIDPSFAPDIKNPEPNGMTPRELFLILNRIKRLQNMLGIDLSEIGNNQLTIKLAAKIISEIG